jgi:hypothetical protein
MLATQLEYFIIGGCTIQVLYSRTMPRVVLAFWRRWSKKKEPALTFALYMRMHCWSTKASTALGHYDNEWFVFTSYNNKWCSMCILLLFLIFPFHNLPCVIFRWWSSIPLVVRYVFRVRRLLNIQMKTYHVKTKIVFFLL